VRRTESAGGIVLNKKGQVLVVSQHGRSWSLPKGHLESGERPLEAAIREIYEESGIGSLSLVRSLGQYQRHRIGLETDEDVSELKVIHMFLFTTEKEELKPADPHNPEARWVEKHQVTDYLTHQKDKEFYLSCLPEVEKL
jgi:bis(5'-nucleosidyl)-tetraphosphatase